MAWSSASCQGHFRQKGKRNIAKEPQRCVCLQEVRRIRVVRHPVPRAVRWGRRPVLHLQVGTTFLVPERTEDMDGIFMQDGVGESNPIIHQAAGLGMNMVEEANGDVGARSGLGAQQQRPNRIGKSWRRRSASQ